MSCDVPVVDVSRLVAAASGEPPREVVERIAAACSEWGFFHAVGHGVPSRLQRRLDVEARRFFAQAQPQKDAVRRSRDNPRGYYDRELTKRVRDCKEIFDFGRVPCPELPEDDPRNARLDGRNRWPAGLPGFRSALEEYFGACERLALRLLEATCAGLGVAPTRLHASFVGAHTSFLRLNHYPRSEAPAPAGAPALSTRGEFGVGPHSDAGALTILAQDDVPSLQVYHAGRWISVAPRADSLVINTGDMLQVWSNDRYRAPLHRVLARSDRERVSAPFFYNPSYESDCAPLEGVVDAEHPPRYRPVNWGEFRRGRADGDYADLGEEVQIAQYATTRRPAVPPAPG
jgi:isopenicillin N synthase-like dioxygenase